MNKRVKKLVSLLLSAVFALSSVLPASALSMSALPTSASVPSEKEEVVYITLNADGTVFCVSVVNIVSGGEITDYGAYTSVCNMTTTDKLTLTDGVVTGSASSERLYYEGILDNAVIPWKISVGYFLNGTEYPADGIAGKSGELELKINISKNESCAGTFFEDYALMATVTLDTQRCENIRSDGATLANVGSDKQLSYIILPGNGADISVKADVTDFQMEPIAVNAVRLNLDIDIVYGELTDKVKELTDAIKKLDDGACELSAGAGELSDKLGGELTDGAEELRTGASELKDGAEELSAGTDTLTSGASEVSRGAASLDDGVTELLNGMESFGSALDTLNSKSPELTKGSAEIKAALEKIQAQLTAVNISSAEIKKLVDSSSEIKSGIAELLKGAGEINDNLGFSQYKAIMKQNGLDIDELQSANEQASKKLTAQIALLNIQLKAIKNIPGHELQAAELESQIEQLTQLVTLLYANNASISGTQTYLDTMSDSMTELYDGISELYTRYSEFDKAIGTLASELTSLSEGMTELKSGIDRLLVAYSSLDGGLGEYTRGVARLVSAYSQLTDGAVKLADGASELKEGADKLYDGTLSFKDGCSGLADGAGKLENGAEELANGVSSLNDGAEELADGAASLRDGTGELKEKTDGLSEEITEKIEDGLSGLTASDSENVSFVSEKNTNIKSVQFVIKTGGVKADGTDTPSPEVNIKLTFWQKLLRLFGLY